jgi:hypothetical protein
MPTFTSVLPTATTVQNLKLRRVPSRGVLHALCLSSNLTVCDTHYWHGRTCPCERQTTPEGFTLDDSMCEPCAAKQGYRPHVYLACWDSQLRQRYLLELTAFAAQPLAAYLTANGTLRGCAIVAIREKGTPNGKVTVTTNAVDLTHLALPNEPSVPAALRVLWRVPANAYDEAPKPAPVNRLRPSRVPLHAMRNQTDNATDPMDPPATVPLQTTKIKQSREKTRFPPNIRNTTGCTAVHSDADSPPVLPDPIIQGNGKK